MGVEGREIAPGSCVCRAYRCAYARRYSHLPRGQRRGSRRPHARYGEAPARARSEKVMKECVRACKGGRLQSPAVAHTHVRGKCRVVDRALRRVAPRLAKGCFVLACPTHGAHAAVGSVQGCRRRVQWHGVSPEALPLRNELKRLSRSSRGGWVLVAAPRLR